MLLLESVGTIPVHFSDHFASSIFKNFYCSHARLVYTTNTESFGLTMPGAAAHTFLNLVDFPKSPVTTNTPHPINFPIQTVTSDVNLFFHIYINFHFEPTQPSGSRLGPEREGV